jgi:hypothetical protein
MKVTFPVDARQRHSTRHLRSKSGLDFAFYGQRVRTPAFVGAKTYSESREKSRRNDVHVAANDVM